MSGENPFGDFEDDFKSTEKALPGSAPGRVPAGSYKFVLATSDPKEDGNLVDHEILVSNNTGSKGLKLFCEILDPATMPNPVTGEAEETKGKIVDHVFWVTKKNLPYILRDISTIIGRDLKSLEELTKISWAGKTFEGVVGDESYQGLVRSRIKFINAWTPEKTDAKTETKKVENPPKDGGKGAAKTGGTGAAKTGGTGAAKTGGTGAATGATGGAKKTTPTF